MSRILHVLTGCTAVGKTELALRWAEAQGAEIVSCDSLLFYRGADIGTAKPTKAELARVPHHLIDLCDLRERMDVTLYVNRARAAVDAILARGRRVLVTGGSGFYLKAYFAPVADEVAVPPELRAVLRARLEATGGLAALVAELHQLNPAGLGALDAQNPRRVLRALERCRASGRTLAQRIGRRVAAMLDAGLVAEVRGLLAQGLKENPSAAGAIGYRETVDFIEGRLIEPELAAAIARNTRALVKKQRTWFKTQLPPHRQVPAATAQVGDLFV
jgi:tRNA dimethylallyltransferase